MQRRGDILEFPVMVVVACIETEASRGHGARSGFHTRLSLVVHAVLSLLIDFVTYLDVFQVSFWLN